MEGAGLQIEDNYRQKDGLKLLTFLCINCYKDVKEFAIWKDDKLWASF